MKDPLIQNIHAFISLLMNIDILSCALELFEHYMFFDFTPLILILISLTPVM